RPPAFAQQLRRGDGSEVAPGGGCGGRLLPARHVLGRYRDRFGGRRSRTQDVDEHRTAVVPVLRNERRTGFHGRYRDAVRRLVRPVGHLPRHGHHLRLVQAVLHGSRESGSHARTVRLVGSSGRLTKGLLTLQKRGLDGNVQPFVFFSRLSRRATRPHENYALIVLPSLQLLQHFPHIVVVGLIASSYTFAIAIFP